MNKYFLLPIVLFSLAGGILAVLKLQTTNNPSNNIRVGSEITEAFKAWKLQYHKVYDSPEQEQFRYQIFSKNYKELVIFNNDHYNTYSKALNQFSDQTTQEFAQRVLMPANKKHSYQTAPLIPNNTPPFSSFQNYAGKVQDQGNCASGWAFAAASQNNFFYGQADDNSFSVQNLIDCAVLPKYEADGCRSGTAGGALQYINEQGQSLESIYGPYSAEQNKCDTNKRGYPKGPVSRSVALKDEYFLVLQKTILSAAVDASTWKDYGYGQFDGCPKNITETNFNHVVNIVGYFLQTESLIIKNSWGTSWGESGYMYLSYKKNPNPCGIFTSADYLGILLPSI